MPTRPIVQHFAVFDDVLFRVRSGGLVPMVHECALYCSEEALDTRVVPAGAFAAHAGRDAMRGEQQLRGSCGILTAAIGVMQESCCGLSRAERPAEGLLGSISGPARAHRPADHRPRGQIQEHGQIQPAR